LIDTNKSSTDEPQKKKETSKKPMKKSSKKKSRDNDEHAANEIEELANELEMAIAQQRQQKHQLLPHPIPSFSENDQEQNGQSKLNNRQTLPTKSIPVNSQRSTKTQEKTSTIQPNLRRSARNKTTSTITTASMAIDLSSLSDDDTDTQTQSLQSTTVTSMIELTPETASSVHVRSVKSSRIETSNNLKRIVSFLSDDDTDDRSKSLPSTVPTHVIEQTQNTSTAVNRGNPLPNPIHNVSIDHTQTTYDRRTSVSFLSDDDNHESMEISSNVLVSIIEPPTGSMSFTDPLSTEIVKSSCATTIPCTTRDDHTTHRSLPSDKETLSQKDVLMDDITPVSSMPIQESTVLTAMKTAEQNQSSKSCNEDERNRPSMSSSCNLDACHHELVLRLLHVLTHVPEALELSPLFRQRARQKFISKKNSRKSIVSTRTSSKKANEQRVLVGKVDSINPLLKPNQEHSVSTMNMILTEPLPISADKQPDSIEEMKTIDRTDISIDIPSNLEEEIVAVNTISTHINEEQVLLKNESIVDSLPQSVAERSILIEENSPANIIGSQISQQSISMTTTHSTIEILPISIIEHTKSIDQHSALSNTDEVNDPLSQSIVEHSESIVQNTTVASMDTDVDQQVTLTKNKPIGDQLLQSVVSNTDEVIDPLSQSIVEHSETIVQNTTVASMDTDVDQQVTLTKNKPIVDSLSVSFIETARSIGTELASPKIDQVTTDLVASIVERATAREETQMIHVSHATLDEHRIQMNQGVSIDSSFIQSHEKSRQTQETPMASRIRPQISNTVDNHNRECTNEEKKTMRIGSSLMQNTRTMSRALKTMPISAVEKQMKTFDNSRSKIVSNTTHHGMSHDKDKARKLNPVHGKIIVDVILVHNVFFDLLAIVSLNNDVLTTSHFQALPVTTFFLHLVVINLCSSFMY
jgi:hypothetical protein